MSEQFPQQMFPPLTTSEVEVAMEKNKLKMVFPAAPPLCLSLQCWCVFVCIARDPCGVFWGENGKTFFPISSGLTAPIC